MQLSCKLIFLQYNQTMRKTKRETPLKKTILALLETYHLLTAAQILEKLHFAGKKVNKTSVYRNLESFLEDDLICQQSFGGDEMVYELQRDHHDHFQCESCGKVEEIPCQVTRTPQMQGYAIAHHHLTLYGRCQLCR